MTKVVEIYHSKVEKRRRNINKIIDVVTHVAEEMMDNLLRLDAAFFVKGNYAEHMGASANDERINIDDLIGCD
jgi:hypothetical protein